MHREDEVHLAFEYHRLAGRRGGFGCDSSGKDGLLARFDVYSCHVSPDRMDPPEPLLVYFMIPLHILTLVFFFLHPLMSVSAESNRSTSLFFE